MFALYICMLETSPQAVCLDVQCDRSVIRGTGSLYKLSFARRIRSVSAAVSARASYRGCFVFLPVGLQDTLVYGGHGESLLSVRLVRRRR